MKSTICDPGTHWTLHSKQVFAVVGMMRSGSNFVERALDDAPDVLCHGELFNPHFVGIHHTKNKIFAGYERENIEKRNDDLEKFHSTILKNSAAPIVGMRIFCEHQQEALNQIVMNAEIKKIILRRNLLEAFLSLKRASNSGQWLVGDKKFLAKIDPIEIDFIEFIQFVCMQSLFFNEVVSTLEKTGQKYVQLDYTEIKSPEKINEIFEFIGSKHRVDVVEEKLVKQNQLPIEKSIANFDEFKTKLEKSNLAPWFL